MFGHLPELLIILVIALVVFGPEKLPEVAANAGKMMREVREVLDTAMNPAEHDAPDDFSTYYYESLARAGEEVPAAEGLNEEDEHGFHYGPDHAIHSEEHEYSATPVRDGATDDIAGDESAIAVDDHQNTHDVGPIKRENSS